MVGRPRSSNRIDQGESACTINQPSLPSRELFDDLINYRLPLCSSELPDRKLKAKIAAGKVVDLPGEGRCHTQLLRVITANKDC